MLKPEPVDGLKRKDTLYLILDEFSRDCRRDDVGTSKCMHCLFNRHCYLCPNCCCFIDDRTPVHRLSFYVYNKSIAESRPEFVYDCGWLVPYGGSPNNDTLPVMPDEITDLLTLDDKYIISLTAPFNMRFSPFHAVPKKTETYGRMMERVMSVIRILENDELKDLDVDKKIKKIIQLSGHTEELKTTYGDDLDFFLEDYWPGQTKEEIVKVYFKPKEVTIEEYMKSRRKLEKEVVNGQV